MNKLILFILVFFMLILPVKVSFAKAVYQKTFKTIDCFNSHSIRVRFSHKKHIKKIVAHLAGLYLKIESIKITGFAARHWSVTEEERLENAKGRAQNVKSFLESELIKAGIK